jgi:diguanylate cyclase
VRALDALSHNKQPITDSLCVDLHQRYLSEAANNETVREAGARIQATINGVSSQMDAARAVTHHYTEALESAAMQLGSPVLGGPIDSEQIRSTLLSVLDTTNGMLAQNRRLEDALTQSSLAMQGLERELEVARKQSLTDGLTALANRKAFDAEISRLWQNALIGGASFSLLMLDIDHFKVFNDTHGHPVGDEVLRLVARTLAQCVRSGDMAARYGGEEFAILLPETALPEALTLANAMRTTVESMSLVRRKGGDKLGRVTLSGGAAEMTPEDSPEALVARADAALYRAKKRGRNRVEAQDNAK